MAEEEVKVFQSFKELIEGDPVYRNLFAAYPSFTYYIYGAAADLTKAGAMSVSIEECVKYFLDKLDMIGKPTYEELETDTEGVIHDQLERAIAPHLTLYLVSHMENVLNANNPKKRTLH